MEKTRELALSAILVALAMGLSYLERLFPLQLLIPLPGVKLGLANVVTMMALYFLGAKTAFAILLVRCLLGGLLGGNISGLAMSLGGGICAFAAMTLAKRLPFFSVYGVSVLGAAAHNTGQVLTAAALLYSIHTFAYLPFLLFVSIVSGFLTGAVSAAGFRAFAAIFSKAVPPSLNVKRSADNKHIGGSYENEKDPMSADGPVPGSDPAGGMQQ